MMISPKLLSRIYFSARELKRMETMAFDPRELKELKAMNRVELLILMKTLGIRVVEKVPVIACTDDELRSAYVIYRTDMISRKKEKWVPLLKQIDQLVRTVYDAIVGGEGNEPRANKK